MNYDEQVRFDQLFKKQFDQLTKDNLCLQNRVDETYDKVVSVEKQILGSQQVLNLEQAAKYIGCKKSYLYRLTAKGEIPHFKPKGKNIYIDVDDLNDWMRQGRVEPKLNVSDRDMNLANKAMLERLQ